MQQLHLVGVTTENDSLIFSVRKGAKSGSYVLPLDEALLHALADAVRRRSADSGDLELPVELDTPAPSPRRQSQLSPREIQDRLRAGRSLEEIAAVAGVGEEWVARFAAPVDAERSQIVHRARQLTYPKPRRGDSAEPLGLSVRWNLAERGVRLTNDEFDAAWSGYQVTDETWMVTFTFVSRKREQQAEWEVDLVDNELVGRNRLASDLGYVEPGRRRRSMASLQPATPAVGPRRSDRPAPLAEAVETPPARTARPTTATKPKAKASPKRTTKASAPRPKPKPVPKSRARTASAPVRKAAAKRPAARPVASGKAAPARKTAPARKAVPARKAAPTRTTGRTAAKKSAPAKRGRTTATAKKKPPAPPAEVVVEKVVPNELGLRRLQLVSGTTRTTTPPRGQTSARPERPRPAPAPALRIAALRSADAVATRPPAPEPAPIAAPVLEAPAPPPRVFAAPAASGLDVLPESRSETEDAAEARRAERRRARAASRSDDGSDDGPVVTIRANRATPPTGESTGDVVVPGDRPPLRPAQPATQPGRRRYSRTRSR